MAYIMGYLAAVAAKQLVVTQNQQIPVTVVTNDGSQNTKCPLQEELDTAIC